MPERLYRCASDIQFDDSVPELGKVITVKLKPFSETCNYLQYQKPLTKQYPCFFAKITSLAPRSVVSIGVAGPDIEDDVHPGQWNSSVGYQNTGRCYTSHYVTGNTNGQRFGVGDVFGVLITYFGKNMSTVMFLNNSMPIATRYLFEPDHTRFLPTIALENGPIELGLMWPEAVGGYNPNSPYMALPTDFRDRWIMPPKVTVDRQTNTYTSADKNAQDVIIQCPLPLSKDTQHFEVVTHEVNESGAGPTIAIATCSPIIPSPTCQLLNDYFRWHPDGKLLKMTTGQRMGWGIHYDPAHRSRPGFDAKEEQLVLCYVTMDVMIIYAKMMLQPPGGWYPVCMLHPYASKVQVDMVSNPRPVVLDKLDELFHKLAPDARKVIDDDNKSREIDLGLIRKSPDLQVEVSGGHFRVTLPRDKKGIHVLQYGCPLTAEQRFFQVSLKKNGDSSVVCMGLADPDFPLNRYPGRLKDTVGYHSRDGKMYYNDKDNGNMLGQRYGKGDTVGLEVEVFERKMSVVLFSKNGRPIGTRYITQTNHDHFLPTVAVCGNSSEVVLDIVWQNQVCGALVYSVTNIEHWCLPEGAVADPETNIISVEPGHTEAEAIQAPYSLHRSYNHFEVQLIDEFEETTPPPAIALCTASPFDPTPKSNFKQDFIRFWATGEAQKAVKKGDLMGWGMLYPDSTRHHDEEQLVICYLTINRDVALTRVMYQPPGGFYPVVLLPPGVNRVKLNFGATIITEHPFTAAALVTLMEEAAVMIADEQRRLAAGTDPEDWDSEENKAKYLKPIPLAATPHGKRPMEKFRETVVMELRRQRQMSRMANLVEVMMSGDNEKTNNNHNKPSPASIATLGHNSEKINGNIGMSQGGGGDVIVKKSSSSSSTSSSSASSSSVASKTCSIL